MRLRLLLLLLVGALVAVPVSAAPTGRLVWMPLDSRPVNTDEVALLASAAGLRVQMPPLAIMDWYTTRQADRDALLDWLAQTAQPGDTTVIYTTTLVTGGLIASRQIASYADLEDRLERVKAALRRLPEDNRIAVQVLPREQAGPDYDRLLEANAHLLDTLLDWAREGLLSRVIVALDDARPDGKASRLHATVAVSDRVVRHYGVDELGFLLVAREALAQKGLRPEITVHVDEPDAVLPYEGVPLKESVAQKLALIDAVPGAFQQVYIHTTGDLPDAAGRPTTVVQALSWPPDHGFARAVQQRLGLTGLNLAGWNTPSNAVGTGLAMAAVADLQRQAGATGEQVRALEAFRVLRFTYDWLYQAAKPDLAAWASSKGIDPNHFGPNRPVVEVRVRETLLPQVRTLLADNVSPSLVEADGRVFTPCLLAPRLEYRWDRLFEVAVLPRVRLLPVGRTTAGQACLNRL